MTIIKELETPEGRISILDSQEKGTRTYYYNNCSHSEIDADGISTCVYIHLMHHLIAQTTASDVLMLGCGGGTLATMLHKDEHRVTVVDISPESFAIAKRYFGMPHAVHCIEEDGLAYVNNSLQTYDAVALDIFDATGIIPAAFTTQTFFRAIHRILRPNGIAVMNIIIEHDFDHLADRIAVNMEKAAMPSVIFDWESGCDRNVIVLAGAINRLRVATKAFPHIIGKELRNLIRRPSRLLQDA